MPGTMATKGSSFRDRFNKTQKKHTDQYTVNKGLVIVGLLLEAKQATVTQHTAWAADTAF